MFILCRNIIFYLNPGRTPQAIDYLRRLNFLIDPLFYWQVIPTGFVVERMHTDEHIMKFRRNALSVATSTNTLTQSSVDKAIWLNK